MAAKTPVKKMATSDQRVMRGLDPCIQERNVPRYDLEFQRFAARVKPVAVPQCGRWV
jgi:hypothetical protein